jgi:hypothetical protein
LINSPILSGLRNSHVILGEISKKYLCDEIREMDYPSFIPAHADT